MLEKIQEGHLVNIEQSNESSLEDSKKQNSVSHEKSQQVHDALCGSRTFYISFHAFTLGMMAIYDNDMKDDVLNGSYGFVVFYACLLSISAYLFLTNGDNPGYAPYVDDLESDFQQELFYSDLESNSVVQNKNKLLKGASDKQAISSNQRQHANKRLSKRDQEEQEEEKVDIDEDDEEEEESKNNSIPAQKDHKKLSQEFNMNTMQNGSDDYIPLGQIQTNESSSYSSQKSQNKTRSTRTSSTDNTNTSQDDLDFVPEMFYCEKCKRSQPFRSKHCNSCGRCVLKFDHHCFWIGGCVGELNHRKFWLFLFLQSLVIYLAFSNCFDAMDRYIIVGKNKQVSYSDEYGAFAVLSFFLFIFFLFTGILCVYHAFLILTNQTTWEHNKRHSLSYLRKLPKGFYPFSQGVIRNVIMVCFHGNQPKEWTVPSVREAKALMGNSFNICENQYYSCC